MMAGGHVTLAVTDLGRAIRFYVETLGMKLVAQDARTGSIDAGDGFLIVLLTGRRPETQKPPFAEAVPDAMVGLHVKGTIEDVVAVLENRGVELLIQDKGPHKRAHFRDPDGNELYLFAAPTSPSP
jgi:catechol 2,3-dioxygenase-like lactoylglutathione lyase family enzyme